MLKADDLRGRTYSRLLYVMVFVMRMAYEVFIIRCCLLAGVTSGVGGMLLKQRCSKSMTPHTPFPLRAD